MNFIGHIMIRNGFKKSIQNHALSHAHLIIGQDGIGKSLLAKEFSLEILNKEENRDYVDIVHYRVLKGKASFGVDDVREIIIEVSKKPYEGDKKVIIIHDGDKLTKQAQNALLKTIEEPPRGVFIMLLCENSELILDTIKSRCQMHKLSPLNKEDIIKYINLNFSDDYENNRDTLIAFSEGIPGRIDKFINDKSFGEIRHLVLELLKDINTRNENIVTKYEEALIKFEDKIEELFDIIISFARDIIVYKETENIKMIINGDKLDKIKELGSMMSYKKLKNVIDVINEARKSLKGNTNTSITFDVMLMNLLEG